MREGASVIIPLVFTSFFFILGGIMVWAALTEKQMISDCDQVDGTIEFSEGVMSCIENS
jgi:hypothetical protein